MGESRDAKDPRDLMRAMRKQEQRDLEREEMHDTGGRSHARRPEPEPEPRRETEGGEAGAGRRVAPGDAAPGGGGRAAGAAARPRTGGHGQ